MECRRSCDVALEVIPETRSQYLAVNAVGGAFDFSFEPDRSMRSSHSATIEKSTVQRHEG